jgi:two-component system, LuxR family, response regulator FixJ
MNAATVFIVDDDPAARDSVAALVRAQGMNVETYPSAEDFLAAYTSPRFGVAVVDMRMAGMTGVEMLETLRGKGVTLPVIIITGFGDIPTAVRAMRAGAFTFLEKPCQEHDLSAAINKSLDQSQHAQRQQAEADEIRKRREKLTPEEHRVMQAMVAGKPNKQIASELDIGLRTVELRRANVLKKLEADSLADLVRLALLIGEIPPLRA